MEHAINTLGVLRSTTSYLNKKQNKMCQQSCLYYPTCVGVPKQNNFS